jgi:hypothetical protein
MSKIFIPKSNSKFLIIFYLLKHTKIHIETLNIKFLQKLLSLADLFLNPVLHSRRQIPRLETRPQVNQFNLGSDHIVEDSNVPVSSRQEQFPGRVEQNAGNGALNAKSSDMIETHI